MEKCAPKGLLYLLFAVSYCTLVFDNVVYANTLFIAEITVDALNIRDQPSTKGNVIGKLNKGEQVTASSAQSGWAKTLFHGETPGYFSTDYMKIMREISSDESSTLDRDRDEERSFTLDGNENIGDANFIAEITVDALNIRDQPSTEGNVIAKLNKGEQVTASSAQSGWAKTLFHGETPGYFSTDYMKIMREISSDESSTLDRDEERSFTLDANENIGDANFIAEITVDALNVRDQPSTEGNVIGKLNKGEQVIASHTQSGWAITLFHGETPGYFSTDYMNIIRVVYSEGLSTLVGQEEEIKCNAESAKLDLDISNIDFKCKENLINEKYKSCNAWFNVAVSTDCYNRMSAIVDCEAEFKLETEDGLEPNQVSVSGLGTIYLNYGRGNGKIKVNWQSGVILDPEINVQVNKGSCAIIAGYDY